MNFILLSHCKALCSRLSSGGKNSKRLERTERTGIVRFGTIFLDTWASKTYNDISKKQNRQVLPVLHTCGENEKTMYLYLITGK